ncbi:MAG: S-layer protein [Paenibacillaceae bacterium]|jgi:hypothetical protein|nr:S-layer protein [Paenibacillaceae bacterium]
MRKHTCSFILSLVLAFSLLPNMTGFAFSDTDHDPGKSSIRSLQEQGIVNGVEDGQFQPQSALTYAQAVHLMVKGFGLNLDRFRFAQQPQASDYFTAVADDAWYAPSFVSAYHNGLSLSGDLDPEALMTREQYAELLCQAIQTKGPYAFIQMFVLIGDEASVDTAYMGSIQTLLIAKIAKLDQDQNFLPKQNISRSEAAVWLNEALKFVAEQKLISENLQKEPVEEPIRVTMVKISEQVNEVVLTRGEKPSPGYGISVDSITFSGNTAVIRYSLHDPLPGRMYPAMVVDVKTSTFVGSQYEIETEHNR